MKAIIAGAGIAGLSAANFLAARDWSVTVLERADGPRQEGYMIDFFGPGFDAAGELGVLPRLRELGYPVARLDYVDAKGRSRAHLDVGSFASMMDGNLVSILRPDLELVLREALPPRWSRCSPPPSRPLSNVRTASAWGSPTVGNSRAIS